MHPFFTARLNRKPYIVRSLILMYLVPITSYKVAESPATIAVITYPLYALFFVSFVLAIIQDIRRCHDLNLVGWFVLINGIPVLGLIFRIYLMVAKGTQGTNRFGEDPLVKGHVY